MNEITGLIQELSSTNFQLILCKLAKHKKGEVIDIKRYNKLFNTTYSLRVKLDIGHLRILYTSTAAGLTYCFFFDKKLTEVKKVYDTDRRFNIPTVFATLMQFRWYASPKDKAHYEQLNRNECRNIYRYVSGRFDV